MTRFLTTPVMYTLLGLLLLAGSAATVQTVRLSNARTEVADERAAHAETKSDHADVLRDLAEQTADVARKVREREAEFLRLSAANDETHRQEKARALASKDRVIADLRSGALQLQDWWRCEVPAHGDSADAAASADSGGAPGGADLRAAGAGSLVQVGAEADGRVRWLQSELIATRNACGVHPL